MRLSLKLWISFIISNIVAVILFTVLAMFLGNLFNKGYTHKTLSILADSVIQEVNQPSATEPSLQEILVPYQVEHPSIGFELFSLDGNVLYSSEGRTNSYTFEEYSNLFVNQPYSLWTEGQSVHLIYPTNMANETGYLHLHIPSEAMQSTQLHIYIRSYSDLINLLIPFLVFIVTPYLFSIYFFYNLRRRLKRLNKGLSETTLDQQMEIQDTSRDEIGQLTRHFNAMSARIRDQVAHIQEQETKRKTLISNLSHDLKTPLTNILGYSDTIQKGLYKNEDDLKAYSEVIVRRSQYMEKLINTLFEASRFDLHGIQINKESCHLPEILRKVLIDYIPVLELKDIQTDLQIPDHSVQLRVDSHVIERSLRNLIDNAITYGANGHFLGVEYKEEDEQVKISVVDRGKGIPEEQLPWLFDRFYQGSQNRNTDGFGLGLSIVKEIALAHGGEVTVTSIPGQETCFTLILPRESDDEAA